jgi:hypothetical protein
MYLDGWGCNGGNGISLRKTTIYPSLPSTCSCCCLLLELAAVDEILSRSGHTKHTPRRDVNLQDEGSKGKKKGETENVV